MIFNPANPILSFMLSSEDLQQIWDYIPWAASGFDPVAVS